jgi:CDP-paratose 2-epimerase
MINFNDHKYYKGQHIFMKVAIITGSAGLIGSESLKFFSSRFDKVIGIDNDMRKYFFGDDASVAWNRDSLQSSISNYIHHDADIRDVSSLEAIFKQYGSQIALVVHTAAQPSHDWAAKEPFTDFTINANGTLNLLELTRQHSPEAVFIFTSTNKVYGDTPNFLPLVEQETRWEIEGSHAYHQNGIDEQMSIDHSKHSIFGASKVAADVLVQEYGRYFGMNTGVFRGGCLTGPSHSGAQLHGFLAYLMKCAISETHYTIFGYKGKQVRDNIHSSDLVNMFDHFYQNPRPGEVYNAGGGRFSNCSVLEAIQLCEEITGNQFHYSLSDQNRSGDHIWYISDLSKFKSHYPSWTWKHDLKDTLTEMFESMRQRVKK